MSARSRSSRTTVVNPAGRIGEKAGSAIITELSFYWVEKSVNGKGLYCVFMD